LVILAFKVMLVFPGWSFLGIYSLVLRAAFVVAMILWALTGRRVRAARIVSTLSSSMRNNLPLHLALPAAVQGRTDKEAFIIRQIGKAIEMGLPLDQALRQAYPACPGDVLGTVEAAQRAGQVPEALQRLEAGMVASLREGQRFRPIHPLYPLLLVWALCFVYAATSYFMLPKFQVIFADYEAELPPSTRLLFSLRGDAAWMLGLLTLLSLVGVGLLIYTSIRPRRPDAPRLLSVLGDHLKWHFPIIHWFERNRAMRQTIESIQLSLRAGCTVDQAVANAALLDVNGCFRGRLRRWHARIIRGENISAAARSAGMGSAVAWAFDANVNPNVPDVLDVLEGFYRNNYSHLVGLVRVSVGPAMVMLLGLAVGFVAYALISPLGALIRAVMKDVIPS
jgi:type II secretory pathway component PulF